MSNFNRNQTDPRNDPRVPPDPASYEEGYLQGRSSDRRVREETHIVREDNNSAASGLLLGLGLAALLALAGAAFWFMNRGGESPTEILTVPVPNSQPQQQQQQPQNSSGDTTIIERTREVIPIPQQQTPEPQQQAPAEAPDININVPSPQEQAPAGSETNVNVSPEQPQTQGTDQTNTTPQ